MTENGSPSNIIKNLMCAGHYARHWRYTNKRKIIIAHQKSTGKPGRQAHQQLIIMQYDKCQNSAGEVKRKPVTGAKQGMHPPGSGS